MRFDGKSYPAERKYMAWSLNSAGSLLRVAAFLIASISDRKDTCECVANSQARHSLQCTLEKNAISYSITKIITGKKSLPLTSSEGNKTQQEF